MVKYPIKPLLGAASALVVLAACSGAPSGTMVEPPQIAPAKATGSYVTFTMHWPAAKGKDQPHYISPSTMSLIVEINQKSALTKIFNNPSKGKATAQTVRIPAPVGRDDFIFTLWNQQNGKGSQLGQGETTRKVVANKPNKIGVSIDGVLASIGIAAAPNQPYLLQSKDATGQLAFAIQGAYAATFDITPLDAGGNIIVPPGTPPKITLASSDSSFRVKKVKGKKNRYTVTPAGWTQPGVHPSLVCKGTTPTGITQTRYAISESWVSYVTYENTGTGSITAYNPAGKAIALGSAFAGLQDPTGIAYDPDDHLLFVADRGNGKLYAFNQDGSAASGFTAPSVPGATGVLYDPADKEVYVTSASGNSVLAFTATGSAVSLSGFAGLASPVGIAYRSTASTNLFYVANGLPDGDVNVFTTSGAASSPPTLGAASSGQTIAGIGYDPTIDELWLTTSTASASTLISYNVDYGFEDEYISSGVSDPFGVTYNPGKDEVYVANQGSNKITAYGYNESGSQALQDPHVHIVDPNGATKPAGIAFVY